MTKKSLVVPPLFRELQQKFKDAGLKYQSHLHELSIRINEDQGFPVLFFQFSASDPHRLRFWYVDGRPLLMFDVTAYNANKIIDKLIKFRLIDSKDLKRFKHEFS